MDETLFLVEFTKSEIQANNKLEIVEHGYITKKSSYKVALKHSEEAAWKLIYKYIEKLVQAVDMYYEVTEDLEMGNAIIIFSKNNKVDTRYTFHIVEAAV
jgi:hypothetical protein